MGRPIKKRFFVYGGGATASDVVKYKGVTVSINAGGTHYSKGATASITPPDWVDGVQATANLTTNSSGVISAATIANPGEGYLTTPTVTVTKPASVTLSATLSTTTSTISGISTTGIYVGMRMDGSPGMPANNYVTVVNTTFVTGTYNFTANTTTNVTFSDQGSGATFTVGLTAAENDTGTIKTVAYLSTGSSAVNSEIIKQEASHRYLVENDQGRGQCKLVASDSPTAGQMNMTATDANGSTYWVLKLTSRKALLKQRTMSGSYKIADGKMAAWTKGSASGLVVQITTY